jgi:Zn-dependent protease/predicted transcriptional regulator
MKWSYKIVSLLGIDLRVHVTFLLIVAWAAYIFGVNADNQAEGAIYGVLIILMLFLCVVIHEMSHSKMAEHYGAEVDSITLLPIGGISQLKNMPDDPKKELWVAIVGPMSNVVIAAFLLVALAVLPNKESYADMSSEEFLEFITAVSLQGFLTYMLVINLMLALFNMMPAYPLDGGRVFRSMLAMFMQPLQATRIAKAIGQTLAFALGLAGVYLVQPIWIIIALFIFIGASQEGAGADMKSVLAQMRVRQALTKRQEAVAPGTSLREVVQIALHSNQEDFPVLGNKGQLVGLLTRGNLLSGLNKNGQDVPVSDVMETEYNTVSPNADFAKVFEKMNETRVRAIPVVDNDMFLGILTLEHLSEVFKLLSLTDPPR